MHWNDLGIDSTWMDTTERRLGRRFFQRIAALLEARGVEDSPLLALRVNDVLVSFLLVRRIEGALGPRREDGENTPPPHQLAEWVGKGKERMRKAIKDLEEHCHKAGTPIDQALPDAMKALVEANQDILEQARKAREKEKRKQSEVNS